MEVSYCHGKNLYLSEIKTRDLMLSSHIENMRGELSHEKCHKLSC
jgi:hypothetical protein